MKFRPRAAARVHRRRRHRWRRLLPKYGAIRTRTRRERPINVPSKSERVVRGNAPSHCCGFLRGPRPGPQYEHAIACVRCCWISRGAHAAMGPTARCGEGGQMRRGRAIDGQGMLENERARSCVKHTRCRAGRTRKKARFIYYLLYHPRSRLRARARFHSFLSSYTNTQEQHSGPSCDGLLRPAS